MSAASSRPSVGEANRKYTLILLVFGIAAVVLGIILSVTITRSIVVPIRGNTRAVKAMAKGNSALRSPRTGRTSSATR